MLYEAVRNYFAVNSTGQLSILYKYLACFVQPLIIPYQTYDQERKINWLVAQCKWQVGQLTNVLNYIYDPMMKRIYITQATIQNVYATKFPYPAILQGRKFGETTPAQVRKFFDALSTTAVIINIPSSVDLSAITATIELVRLQGIQYTINVFT